MKERGKRSFNGTKIMKGNACLGVSEIKMVWKKETKKKKNMYIGVGKKWSYSILMMFSENNKVWSSL